jgi:predicted Ser/Thr protein kinase
MNPTVDSLEQLIEARLAGHAVEIPATLQAGFDQAMAAHAALQELIDETVITDPSLSPRLPPEVSGTYEIERELGRGGMGIVYLARQRSLDRRVALKVLRPGERTFGPLLRRFLDEAQHLARLQHPNIVSIHEVGNAAGEPYFTMDFIDGETLSAVIARGPLRPTRAIEVLKQVGAAIQHAHRHGIIHRDLKPGNVLIDQAGQVFVTDFGLARNVGQESNLTQTGELLGTPQYMSPEQARGQTSMIGEPTDIHALGLLLFEMLTGRSAFGASSPADVLVKLLNDDPPPLRSLDRCIPRDLETICMKALRKSPDARYANASALLEDVRRFEAGEPLLARRTSFVMRVARWAGRRWRMAATILVTAALVGTVAPRLFDKSVAELVVWGDEEFKRGNPEIATQIFLRAWNRSEPARRTELVPHLADAIKEITDPKQAVEAGLKVIELAPDVSFGKHDFVMAQSLAMAARADTPDGFFEPAHAALPAETLARRELAARRLTLFLEGAQGTREERAEAERTLQAIERSLRSLRPTERWTGDEIVRLPQLALPDLQVRAADSTLSPWERAKAQVALGRLHETGNDTASALGAYRSALDQMRRVYPFVAGVVSDSQIHATGKDDTLIEAPECRLLRELLQSLSRLDPDVSEQVTGGVRLRFDHPEFLKGVHVSARLTLCDPTIKNPYQGLSRNLSTCVPMSVDAPSEVTVLPGKYRLALTSTSMKWNSTEPDVRLISIAAEQWPTTLEIHGEMIDLPPLSVRKLHEIRPTQPAHLSRIDLQSDSLAWSAVPGATHYDVNLAHFADIPHPTVTYFHTIRVEGTSLTPSKLSPSDQKPLRTRWLNGHTAGFRVQALNAAGHCIGTSLEDRRFLIATALH